ncbi:sensor histidine kinase [Algibacter amylolyticus]|nr:histidine kinase [Algibacter amylolyticus]MBB5266683.1 sensor histidine kinase YesM [Algibacter amylolyticus]
MKILSFLFVFLFLGMYCYAQDVEELPAQPWEELVEMHSIKKNPIRKWGDSINISIEGLYKASDSLTIARIIKKLDSLTETTTVSFSNTNKSNFKIKFLDKYVKDEYNQNRNINSKNWYNSNKVLYGSDLYIYTFKKTDLEVKNRLENQISRILVDGWFAYARAFEKRQSIFNPSLGSLLAGTLNSGDISIIKEVYKKGFEKRLLQAEQQFSYVLDKLENDKIKSRDRSLWWVKNPIAVIFLPTLVLVLFFIFLISKIKRAIQIKKELLRFAILSFVILLFASFVIVFCVSFFDFLTIPDDYTKVPIVRKDTIVSTIAALVPLFPLLFLFRFIELKIQKSSQNIFIKTVLVFLSTGILPFLCIVIGFLFALKRKGDLQGGLFFMSKVFLVLMSLASLRALISYFIFKERSLIIENETKLSHLRELKSKAELKSLQSQINPHFLYNALNSIASLAPINANKTQKMVHSLSDLFKYSINRKGKKMSTVKDEIEMVTSYLNIEKIRFGNRLQFDIEVDETLMNNEIPLFLIQPLVENAVKHGISQNEGEGTIRLKIEKVDNQLVISVKDNGPDFPEGLVSGHGLQTVYDLLRLSYGNNATLNWTNTPEKTITITIPETV